MAQFPKLSSYLRTFWIMCWLALGLPFPRILCKHEVSRLKSPWAPKNSLHEFHLEASISSFSGGQKWQFFFFILWLMGSHHPHCTALISRNSFWSPRTSGSHFTFSQENVHEMVTFSILKLLFKAHFLWDATAYLRFVGDMWKESRHCFFTCYKNHRFVRMRCWRCLSQSKSSCSFQKITLLVLMLRFSDYSMSSNYTLQQLTCANSTGLLFGSLPAWHHWQHVIFTVPVWSCHFKY